MGATTVCPPAATGSILRRGERSPRRGTGGTPAGPYATDTRSRQRRIATGLRGCVRPRRDPVRNRRPSANHQDPGRTPAGGPTPFPHTDSLTTFGRDAIGNGAPRLRQPHVPHTHIAHLPKEVLMIRKHVKQHEVGLLFRRGDFHRLLGPGDWFVPRILTGTDKLVLVDTLETRFGHR